MSKKPLEFVPKPNKWFRSTKTIAFTIAGTFSFVEKNIFYKFHFQHIAKAISKLYSKVFGQVRFVPHKIYFLLKFFASTIGKTKIICKVAAKINMKVIANATSQFTVTNQISPVLILIAKPKWKNKFYSKNQTKYTIKCFLKSPNGKVEFLNKCNAHMKLSAISEDQKISFLQNTLASMRLLAKVSGKQNVALLSKANGSLVLMSEVALMAINIGMSARAYVYRPIVIEILYPDVIEDWYEWPIEDTFFGQELL